MVCRLPSRPRQRPPRAPKLPRWIVRSCRRAERMSWRSWKVGRGRCVSAGLRFCLTHSCERFPVVAAGGPRRPLPIMCSTGCVFSIRMEGVRNGCTTARARASGWNTWTLASRALRAVSSTRRIPSAPVTCLSLRWRIRSSCFVEMTGIPRRGPVTRAEALAWICTSRTLFVRKFGSQTFPCGIVSR